MRIPKNLISEGPRRVVIAVASAAAILTFAACSSNDDDGDGVTDGDEITDGDAVPDIDDLTDVDALIPDDGIISSTLPFQERIFEPLDDGSPLELSTAYGDRTEGPHGLFATIPGNTSTGLIRRTNSFRAHVISGVIENPFDNEGNPPVLEAGSFWSVASGALHSTNCVSAEPCEIFFYQDGAFDTLVDGVDPLPEAVEDDGVPSVTIPAEDREFEMQNEAIAFAQAYGDRAIEAPQGFFGIFIGNFAPPLHTHTHGYHAIVFEGIVTNPFDEEENPPQLGPGSHWSVEASALHTTACVSEEPCTWFLYSDNDFDFLPVDDLSSL